jgi:hypothetical protein
VPPFTKVKIVKFTIFMKFLETAKVYLVVLRKFSIIESCYVFLSIDLHGHLVSLHSTFEPDIRSRTRLFKNLVSLVSQGQMCEKDDTKCNLYCRLAL